MKNRIFVTWAFLTTFFLLGSLPAVAAEEHSGGHGAGHATQTGTSHESAGIQAEGKLVAIHHKTRKVTLNHGPIAALGWPPMRMDFAVQPGVDLHALKVGQKVSFTLMKTNAYDYAIAQMAPVHAH